MPGQKLNVTQRAARTSRAARVVKVRRPEWDEHPFNPIIRNALLNQTTMLSAVMGPPRSDRMIGPELVETSRKAISARRRSACT